MTKCTSVTYQVKVNLGQSQYEYLSCTYEPSVSDEEEAQGSDLLKKAKAACFENITNRKKKKK